MLLFDYTRRINKKKKYKKIKEIIIAGEEEGNYTRRYFFLLHLQVQTEFCFPFQKGWRDELAQIGDFPSKYKETLGPRRIWRKYFGLNGEINN